MPCLACHGEKGYSEQPAVPSLGGQPAPYLLIQLYRFQENQRSSLYRKGDQMIQVMSEMTKEFSDNDLRTFSDFLARLPPPQDTPELARMQSGRTLITQHRCNSCHNLDLWGRENAFRASPPISPTSRAFAERYRGATKNRAPKGARFQYLPAWGPATSSRGEQSCAPVILGGYAPGAAASR